MTKEELEILKGEIAERLVEALKHKKVNTAAELARILDSSHPLASNYYKKERTPTMEYLSILAQAFKDLNIRWILTGEGTIDVKNVETENSLASFDDQEILTYITTNRERFKENVTTKRVFDAMYLDEWMSEIEKVKDDLIKKYGKD